MKGLSLVINFIGENAYLSDSKALSLQNTGLPKMVKIFTEPASCTFKVLSYNRLTKMIIGDKPDFRKGDLPFSSHQIDLANELEIVEVISFINIDTYNLLKILPSIAASPKIIDTGSMPYINEPKETAVIHKPKPKVIKETVTVDIRKVQFKDGFVTFDKNIKQLKRILEISIVNPEIKAEFDAIKNYFANVLGTKKIQAELTIEFLYGQIGNIEAHSPEIERINQSLIDNVRFEFVKGFKKIKPEVSKTLLTENELFDALSGDKIKPNIFYQNGKNLLDDLLSVSNSKHYKHLRYLSDKHSHLIMKLRFVIKPFSFVFLIEGAANYHIIWETLDTEEATYIWKCDKDIHRLKLELKKVEDIINAIKTQGKISYIHTKEANYSRIFHDYSNEVEGFIKWKEEVDSVLNSRI